MRSERKIFVALSGLAGGALLTLIITRIKVRNSRKRLLKKVDVFAEPFKERLDEFIDIIVVTFDAINKVITTIFPRRNNKPVKREPGVRTTPGRYVIPKVYLERDTNITI
jgi:hypothetical protein